VNEKITTEVPFQMNNAQIKPEYKTFRGWKTETSQIKEKENLPKAMNSYIQFINQNLSAKVHYISNGPGRDQIVKIEN